MRILNSLLFRIRRLLGVQPTGRYDTVRSSRIKNWIRRQDNCIIESDLQVRGHDKALDHLSVGARCAIDKGCIFWVASESDSQPRIILGNQVYIGPYCFIGSDQLLSIGENSIIGGFSYLITANHRSDLRMPVQDQGYVSAPIQIGCDVWIGCHVVILPGVTIGDQAIIGAGAVVNRNVPAGEKWAGVPAKKIGSRVSG